MALNGAVLEVIALYLASQLLLKLVILSFKVIFGGSHFNEKILLGVEVNYLCSLKLQLRNVK